MQENQDAPQSHEDYYGTSKEISRLISNKSRRRYATKNIIGFFIFLILFVLLLPSAAIGILSIPAQIAHRKDFIENYQHYLDYPQDVYLRVYEFYDSRIK